MNRNQNFQPIQQDGMTKLMHGQRIKTPSIPLMPVYKNLDDMAADLGVEKVLEFLAHSPTEVDGVYRHTMMKTVPYIVKRSQSNNNIDVHD